MLAKIEDSNYVGLFGLDGSPMDFRTPRVWIALRARAGREQVAADWLKVARLFAYWPSYSKEINAGRGKINGFAQRRSRYCALIPGYLFVACQQGLPIHPAPLVDTTPGVLGYMRDGSGHPLTVGNEDIDTIRRIESGENLPPNKKTAHKFRVGDKVRFSDDLMGRWPHGVIERLADDGRISVGVPLLGRVVSILVFPHQIEAM